MQGRQIRAGERILGRLAELDRDMAWLARVLGVNQSTVSRWVVGGVPEQRVREVALALHRSEAWLKEGPVPEQTAA